MSTYVISHEDLLRLAFLANDLGKRGERVLGVEVLAGPASTGQVAFAFETDRGPESATENWETR